MTQAWASTSLELWSCDLSSSLLCQLARGCRQMVVHTRDLAEANLQSRLEAVQLQHLFIEASDTDSAAVGAFLAGCRFPLELSCYTGVVPTLYPHQLRALTVELRTAPRHVVTALLQTLAGLPHLAELSWSWDLRAPRPACQTTFLVFPRFAS